MSDSEKGAAVSDAFTPCDHEWSPSMVLMSNPPQYRCKRCQMTATAAQIIAIQRARAAPVPASPPLRGKYAGLAPSTEEFRQERGERWTEEQLACAKSIWIACVPSCIELADLCSAIAKAAPMFVEPVTLPKPMMLGTGGMVYGQDATLRALTARGLRVKGGS